MSQFTVASGNYNPQQMDLIAKFSMYARGYKKMDAQAVSDLCNQMNGSNIGFIWATEIESFKH